MKNIGNIAYTLGIGVFAAAALAVSPVSAGDGHEGHDHSKPGAHALETSSVRYDAGKAPAAATTESALETSSVKYGGGQAPAAKAEPGHEGHDHAKTPETANAHSAPAAEPGHEGHDHAKPQVSKVEPGHEGHDHAKSPEPKAGAQGHSGAPTEEKEVKIDGLVEEKARIETVYDTVKANGTVSYHPDHYARVTALVPGRVKKLSAMPGDRVEKGAELAVLESIEIFNAKSEFLKNLNRYEVALAKYETVMRMGEMGAFTQKNVEEASSSLVEARSQLEKARIAVEAASRKHERIKKLVGTGVSSRSELEAAESELRNASVELEAAKARFENIERSANRVEKMSETRISLRRETADIQTEFNEARLGFLYSMNYLKTIGIDCDMMNGCAAHDTGSFSLRAPIHGTVLEHNVFIGSSVDTQTAVMTIGDMDTVAVDIDIYESDYSRVARGMRVTVEAPGGKTEGRIVFLSNQIDQSARTLKARAYADGASGFLKAGAFVDCGIIVGERSGAVTIPAKAIVDDGGRSLVFVKCGKSYDKVYVKTGARQGDRVEVLEGLDGSSVVVTVGNYQLFNMGLSGKLELSCDGCK